MLSILSKSSNFKEEDLINELINSENSKENLDEIYSKLTIDLNKIYIEEEPILHLCCKKDNYKSVEWLLENRIDINIKNAQNETAIFYAIYSRNSAMLQLLVEYGSNINHLNIQNRTALQESINSANSSVIRYLLQITTLKNSIDIHGNTLLFDAVSNGNIQLISAVAGIKGIDINHTNKARNSVLHLKNVLENPNIASLLLDFGANPTILNENKESYLFYIVQNGIKYIDILRKIGEFKYDLNMKNRNSRTILMEAVNTFLQIQNSSVERKEEQKLLIKEIINLNLDEKVKDNYLEDASFYITKTKDRDLISSFLYRYKVDLNIENIHGLTPLFYLVLGGIVNKDLVKLYIEKGANVNKITSFHKTIIEILIDIVLHFENNQELDEDIKKLVNENGQYKELLELIARFSNIQVNALNIEKEPLFFKTILNFNFKLFAILKSKNLNIKALDRDGNNIIFRLINHNNQDLIKDKRLYLNTIRTLKTAGININQKNNLGQNALHIAITQKCQDTITLLLNLGIDYFETDNQGRTIMHLIVLNNTSRYFHLINSLNKSIVEIADIFGVKPINYAAFMGKTELVLEMIKQGAELENSNILHPNILRFLEKFHVNLVSLEDKAESQKEKEIIKNLVSNMIKEFGVKA